MEIDENSNPTSPLITSTPGEISTSPSESSTPTPPRSPVHHKIPEGQHALDPLEWMSQQRSDIKNNYPDAKVRVITVYKSGDNQGDIPVDTYSFPGDDKKFYCIPVKWKIEIYNPEDEEEIYETLNSPEDKESYFYTLQTAEGPLTDDKRETVIALGTLLKSVTEQEGLALLGVPPNQNPSIQPITIQAKLSKIPTAENTSPNEFKRKIEDVVVFRGRVKVGSYQELQGKELTFVKKIQNVFGHSQEHLRPLFQKYAEQTKAHQAYLEHEKKEIDDFKKSRHSSSSISLKDDEEETSLESKKRKEKQIDLKATYELFDEYLDHEEKPDTTNEKQIIEHFQRAYDELKEIRKEINSQSKRASTGILLDKQKTLLEKLTDYYKRFTEIGYTNKTDSLVEGIKKTNFGSEIHEDSDDKNEDMGFGLFD